MENTRRSYRFGTWNVRGLDKKIEQVFSEIRRENMDVVVLTETKLLLEEKDFGFEEFEDYIHLFSGKKKELKDKTASGGDKEKSDEHASGGLSIIFKKEFAPCDFYTYTENYKNNMVPLIEKRERLIMTELNICGITVVVIGVYWLDNCAPSEYKKSFQKDLEILLERSNCNCHELVILGDFNSRVGMDSKSKVVGKYGEYEKMNDNGSRLTSLCSRWKLKIQNTFFNHEDMHKYTWYFDSKLTPKRHEDPESSTTNHRRSLIDFCITKQETSFFVEDVLACRWLECGTDHKFLEATLSFKSHVLQDILDNRLVHEDIVVELGYPKYRTYLLYSVEIRKKYQEILENLLNNYSYDPNSTEEMYQCLKVNMHSAAFYVLGPEKKNQLGIFLRDQEIRDLRESRQRRIDQFKLDEINELKDEGRLDYSQFKRAKSEVRKRMMRECQWEEDLFNFGHRTEDDFIRYWDDLFISKDRLWTKDDIIKHKNTVWRQMIQQWNESVFLSGECQTEKDFIKYKNQVWEGICSEIMNNGRYRKIKVSWDIVHDLKNQYPSTLKMRSEHIFPLNIREKVVPVVNIGEIRFVNPEDIEKELNHLNDDCSIPFPGGLTLKLLKYSGLTAVNLLCELINKIFQEEKEIPIEIREIYCTDNPIRNEELFESCIGNGFTHSIMTVMREVFQNILKEYVSFEDIKVMIPIVSDRDATFILRLLLLKNAAKKDPPLHFVLIDLFNFICDIKFSILFSILLKAGLPIKLINIIKNDTFMLDKSVLPCILKEALTAWNNDLQNVITGNERLISHFLNGSKLVIVSHSKETMEFLISKLRSHLHNTGFLSEFENITYLGKGSLKIDNMMIEGKEVVKFHDSILQLDGKNEKEIRQRILDTNKAIGILHSAARDEMITKENKINIFKSIIQSILLHGSETWTITNVLKKDIKKAELSYWKWCFENYSHAPELNDFTNDKKSISHNILEMKATWYYHIMESENAEWIREVLHWEPDGKNRCGKPIKWVNKLNNNLKKYVKQKCPNCYFCLNSN